MEWYKLPLFQLRNHLLKKDLRCVELAQSFLKRAHEHQKEVNAFITFNENLEEEAQVLDRRLAKGEDLSHLKLLGMPLSIKDMICTKGLKTTAASRMLSGFVPTYDAHLVTQLKEQGALILGKSNMDEFAMGCSTERSFYGPCKNPWNKNYVSGGSSGGAAAGQALSMAVASVGTDTGGSVRQPASFCGVVGLKPTYGRVSRYGVIAFASSLDQAGPIAHCVEDAALLLSVMGGKDPKDMTSSSKGLEDVEDFVQVFEQQGEGSEGSRKLDQQIKMQMEEGKKLSWAFLKLSEEDEVKQSPCVAQVYRSALQHLRSEEGLSFKERSFPHWNLVVPVYYLVCASEAAANLARYDGIRYGWRSEKPLEGLESFYANNRGEGFGEEVKRRILLGTYTLSKGYYQGFYQRASQVRALLSHSAQKDLFAEADVLLMPVALHPPFKLGEKLSHTMDMYLGDQLTALANLLGFPAISLPVGFSKEGLPIGLQLMAKPFQEKKLLQAAFLLQRCFRFKEKVMERGGWPWASPS